MAVGIDLLWALVYIAALCLFVYVALWMLATLVEVQLPAKVVQILWVIVLLIALIILISTLVGHGPQLGLRRM